MGDISAVLQKELCKEANNNMRKRLRRTRRVEKNKSEQVHIRYLAVRIFFESDSCEPFDYLLVVSFSLYLLRFNNTTQSED